MRERENKEENWLCVIVWESTRFLYLSLCDGSTTCTHTKIDKRHGKPFQSPLFYRLPFGLGSHARTLHWAFQMLHHSAFPRYIHKCIYHPLCVYLPNPILPFSSCCPIHIHPDNGAAAASVCFLWNNRQQTDMHTSKSINTFMLSAAWMKRESKQNELTRQHVHSSPYTASKSCQWHNVLVPTSSSSSIYQHSCSSRSTTSQRLYNDLCIICNWNI